MIITRIATPPTVQDAPGEPEIVAVEYQRLADPRAARLQTIWDNWYIDELLEEMEE